MREIGIVILTIIAVLEFLVRAVLLIIVALSLLGTLLVGIYVATYGTKSLTDLLTPITYTIMKEFIPNGQS